MQFYRTKMNAALEKEIGNTQLKMAALSYRCQAVIATTGYLNECLQLIDTQQKLINSLREEIKTYEDRLVKSADRPV